MSTFGPPIPSVPPDPPDPDAPPAAGYPVMTFWTAWRASGATTADVSEMGVSLHLRGGVGCVQPGCDGSVDVDTCSEYMPASCNKCPTHYWPHAVTFVWAPITRKVDLETWEKWKRDDR